MNDIINSKAFFMLNNFSAIIILINEIYWFITINRKPEKHKIIYQSEVHHTLDNVYCQRY